MSVARREWSTSRPSAGPSAASDYRVHAPIGEAPRRQDVSSSVVQQSAAGGQEDEERRRVFLGNLSFKIDEDAVCQFFKKCGRVENVHWVTDKQTGQFYGSAFCRFQSADAVEKALALNGAELLGRPIKISAAARSSSAVAPAQKPLRVPPIRARPAGCTTVFVGGLHEEVTDDDMWNTFHECGEIADVRYVMDKDTGQFKRCAFIDFAHESATVEAAKLHGTLMRGKTIRIDFSDPK